MNAQPVAVLTDHGFPREQSLKTIGRLLRRQPQRDAFRPYIGAYIHVSPGTPLASVICINMYHIGETTQQEFCLFMNKLKIVDILLH